MRTTRVSSSSRVSTRDSTRDPTRDSSRVSTRVLLESLVGSLVETLVNTLLETLVECLLESLVKMVQQCPVLTSYIPGSDQICEDCRPVISLGVTFPATHDGITCSHMSYWSWGANGGSSGRELTLAPLEQLRWS